jgi:peptidoglycan/LPS O-acetylase OafA/YrhL
MSQTGARQPKLISLEVARFIAALAVAIEHLAGSVSGFGLPALPFTAPAPAAVTFFFCLSGFVIHQAHARDSGQWRRLPRYIWRRFTRIYPVYWLSLVPLIYYMWPHLLGAGLGTYRIAIFTLAPFTSFHLREFNPPAWTLRFELSFYLLFGIALLPYARRVVLPLWGGLLALAYLRRVLLGGTAETLLPFLPVGVAEHLLALNNIYFFAGIAASMALFRAQPGAAWLWRLLAAAGFALILLEGASDWGDLYPPAARLPLVAAAAATAIYALAALERGSHWRINPRWALLGSMSYPLYLLHPSVGFLFAVHFLIHPLAARQFSAYGLFWLMLGLSLLASALVAFLFDAPLQRLARRVL